MNIRLSIAIINFNSGHRLEECLQRLRSNAPSDDWEAVVVDNHSSDGSADFLRVSDWARVRLLESPVNLLWTGGVNLAFQMTRGTYFLIMNSDIAPLPGAIQGMMDELDRDPSIGAIGGSLVTASGQAQRYFSRFVTPWQLFRLKFMPRRRKSSKLQRWYAMDDVDFRQQIDAPRPAGGCLMVRRELFPDLPMGREFGIYWSDYDIAKRVWATKLRVVVDPRFQFVHDDQAGVLVGPTPALRDLDYLVGAVRFFKRHYGTRTALVAKILLSAGALGTILAKYSLSRLRGTPAVPSFASRIRLFFLFLRDRNLLLEQAQPTTKAKTAPGS